MHRINCMKTRLDTRPGTEFYFNHGLTIKIRHLSMRTILHCKTIWHPYSTCSALEVFKPLPDHMTKNILPVVSRVLNEVVAIRNSRKPFQNQDLGLETILSNLERALPNKQSLPPLCLSGMQV